MQFKASAPGSLMLLGEYAVLHGKYALVCAVDKRITVTLTPRLDDCVEIHSTLHGKYVTRLANLTIERPFHFVLATLQHYQAKLKQGCDISITSTFSDQIGLGSSAAVTVATLAVLNAWLRKRSSSLDLVRQGRKIIRGVQGGVGSGADVAASVYGGIVAYRATPVACKKLTALYPLTVWYAGYKTPTAEVIRRVQEYFAPYPKLFRQIYNTIGHCTLEAMHWMKKNNWAKVGEIMNIQQGLMDSLGVSTPHLQEMITALRQQEGILGAKISGSGLGDCVIGLGYSVGRLELKSPPPSGGGLGRGGAIPITISLQGVQYEKI